MEDVVTWIAGLPIVRVKHHAVAFRPVRLGAGDFDDAGGVRAGDEVLFGFERVGRVVVSNENVAVVERDGVDADEDLFGARSW